MTGNHPVWDWVTASPESQGISSMRLEALWSNLAQRNTHALLVMGAACPGRGILPGRRVGYAR